MNLEEITKIWSSFNRPFRLSLCYEVSIVRIQSEERPREIRLVERTALSAGGGGGGGGGTAGPSENEFEVIPAIGKRNLSRLKEKGWNLIAMRSDHIADITDVKPFAVQPGMALSIFGRNFKGKRLVVKIGERTIIDGREIDAQVDAEVNRAIRDSQEINETLLRTLLRTLLGRLLGTSFRVINENLIKVKIPPDEEPGIKSLSLASEEEEKGGGGEEEPLVVATFEVLPAEPQLITITEIRPDKGIPDDLITIMGINFTEDARVTIGDRNIERITFVDNSQINIMIPLGLTPGTTMLAVSTDQGTASRQFRIL
jgi:hypothetical protein